jgi:hypothetical protein
LSVVDEDEDLSFDDQLIDDSFTKPKQPRELGPHPSIQTFVHFPDYNLSRAFRQGEDVVVLVGVSNQSPNVYFNISHIGAQLHSPYDFSYYIQNFTVREMEAVVGPGQETTVEYRFHPDPTLEPIDFQLSAWIYYNSSEGYVYQTTIFNETIELLEKYEPWTLTSLFNTALVLAGFGIIGYVVFNLAQTQTGPKKRVKRVPLTVEEKQVVAQSWTPEIYTQGKARSVRRTGSKKGSKKSDSKDSKTEKTVA